MLSQRLSITECRKHLKDQSLTDGKVEELRDCLYLVAELLINEFLKDQEADGGKMSKTPSLDANGQSQKSFV